MSEFSVETNNTVPEENSIANQMNFFQRLVGVIISPTETMRNLAAKPRILFPILLIALAALAMNLIRYPIYSEATRQVTLQTNEAVIEKMGDKLPEDQVKSMRDNAEKSAESAPMQGLIFTPLTTLAFWFFGTLILFWIVKILKDQLIVVNSFRKETSKTC